MKVVPKQFKHWCRLAKLKPICHRMYRSNVLYYKGFGRQWRVNQLTYFDMSDLDFDRWANSLEKFAPIPQTQKSFFTLLIQMLGPEDTNSKYLEAILSKYGEELRTDNCRRTNVHTD